MSSLDQSPKSFSKSVPLVFLKGLDSTSRLKEVIDHFDSSKTEWVIVEPSRARYDSLLSDPEIKKWLDHPRVHWWVQKSPEDFFAEAYEFLRTPVRLFHMRAAKFIEGAALDKSEQTYFSTIEDEWLACQKQRMRSLGGIEDSKLGFQNVIENKSFIEETPGILELKDLFFDRPAIVISTGPSLRKSLESLKKLQDQAVLISADASLKILLDEGITPHFVCSIERDRELKAFFESTGPIDSNLVVYPLVPAEVFNAFSGPRWVAYRDYGYFYYLERDLPRGILPSSSSVAHMALRLAQYMGCPKIALVGQDLSYDPVTLQSHPKGVVIDDWASTRSLEEIKQKAKNENLGEIFAVDGNLQDTVTTNSVYFSFIKEFSWEATQSQSSITNCTHGGARIPNIPWQDLNIWAQNLPAAENILEKIKSRRLHFKKGELKLQIIHSFLQDLNSRWRQVIPLLKGLNAQAMPVSQKSEIYKSLRASEKQMLDDVRYITIVIQNAGREYLDIVNDLEVFEIESKTSSQEYYALVESLYKLIDRVTSQLLSCF